MSEAGADWDLSAYFYERISGVARAQKEVGFPVSTQVIPKVRLDRRPFNPARGAREVLGVFEVPRKRLRHLPAPTSQFSPAVDVYWTDALHKKLLGWGLAALGADAVLTTAAGLPIALAVPASTPLLIALWSALQLGLLPLGVAYSRLHRAEKRNLNAFLLWLRGRYGVTLNAKQGLPKYLRKNDRYESLLIVASDGAELKVYRDYKGVYVSGAHEVGELQPSVTAIPPKKPKVAVEMTAEAKALVEQIGEHLAVLSERDLGPESVHVVDRARRDRDKVVALHADLVRLNALDEVQEVAIAESFTALLVELAAVVKAETQRALKELTVENTYIAARKQREGLSLTKVDSPKR